MSECAHERFEGHVRVNRLADVGRFFADVELRCAECGTRFRWIGVPAGLAPDRPMVSPDGFELRAPVVPDAHLTTLMADDPDLRFPTVRMPKMDDLEADA